MSDLSIDGESSEDKVDIFPLAALVLLSINMKFYTLWFCDGRKQFL